MAAIERFKKQKIEGEQEYRKRIQSRVSEKMKLPEEMARGCCGIRAIGSGELIVENFKNILSYQPEKIVALTRQCRVEVSGKHLEIRYFSRDEMKITGKIENISFKG